MRPFRILVALVVASVTLVALPALAQEAPPGEGPQELSLSTPYPRVAIEAGDQASFDLTLTAPAPTELALATSGLPSGWSATFRGGGFEIDGVTAGPTAPEVTLDVTVPLDMPDGAYDFVVSADGAGTSLTLDLQVRVSAQAGGEVTLTPDFPGLRLPAGETASFSVELRNDTPSDLQFELESAGPAGWDVSAQPSTEPQAATIQVDSGSSTTIDVDATSLPRTEAGQYTISVQATAPETQVQAEMIVEIVGSFSLDLTTTDQRLSTEVSADGSSEVELVLTNTGTAPIQGVELSAQPPSGWDVAFAEPVIAEVGAGQSATAVATVTPSDQAIAGDYVITFSADSEQANAEVDIRTTVNPSPLWGFIGVALIALTLAALAWVFRRFGRR
ncbi:MAG TPA: NEW3 domain-containing protein [Acidimicrobiia bacterium]|nr:NEW3 domain-containing protein [Acidimicrobiia bacterium]